MSRAEPLYRLQLVDLELDQAARTLREVETALAGNPAVQHAQSELAAAQKVYASLSARVRSLELDSKGQDAKLREAEERLYSGNIRSPKELIDLQRDIEMLKRQRDQMNETLLAAMLEMDEAQQLVTHCQKSLDEASAHWEEDSVALREQHRVVQEQIAAAAERRAAIVAVAPAADLALYQALRVKKANRVAVAIVKNKACSQCGEAPSSMLLQQARGDMLVTCPNCGRILYSV
ncbi:MAG: zinc ribbon domain-containing protein [Anaerolineae bacterium]